MKWCLALAAALALSGQSRAQQPETNLQAQPQIAPAPTDRLLFPRDFARGFVDFQMAPPHNEIDLGLCQVKASDPEYRADCTAYARFTWSGYLELQPFGRTPLRRLFLIAEPKFFGGNNLPQQRYTFSAAPILMELSMGAGIALSNRAELRMITHKAHLLGRYADSHTPVNLAGDGPYGSYTTVGVRYYFGNYGRSQMSR
jgi:hypothetical protein